MKKEMSEERLAELEDVYFSIRCLVGTLEAEDFEKEAAELTPVKELADDAPLVLSQLAEAVTTALGGLDDVSEALERYALTFGGKELA